MEPRLNFNTVRFNLREVESLVCLGTTEREVHNKNILHQVPGKQEGDVGRNHVKNGANESSKNINKCILMK